MKKRVKLQVGVACLSGFLQGYNLCFIGSLLVALQRSLEWCYPCEGDYSNEALSRCSCPAKHFAVSAVSIGAIVGGLAGGFVSDAIGRRLTLIALAILFAAGAAMMAAASKEMPDLFFLGRLVSGVAVGGSGQASVYIAEIAPPELRGTLMTLNELGLGIGCVMAAVAAALIGDSNWRLTISIGGCVALAQAVGVISLLQESPRWLLSKGQVVRAQKAAAAIGLDFGHIQPEDTAKPADTSVCAELMLHKRAMFLALCCGVGHAVTATNTVLYYSRNILQRSGVQKALEATILVDALKLFGIIMSCCLADRVGRKRLLAVGTSGIICGHFGISFAFGGSHSEEPLTAVATASLCLFIVAWNISWSGLMLVVASELLPQSLRGLGLGAVYATYWLISGVEEQTLPDLFEAFGESATFAFYGACSIGTLLFVLFLLPETSGSSLEDVSAAVDEAVLGDMLSDSDESCRSTFD
eukprot:TRINITY_DN29756_c0_g1_i2.p1 TRINITY_DN29756_c0_g1~~TRINITY_DN29756_c0_g1_i2.p1  ORF type:complete len:506 (+),score=70.19 TRINITY_DN29756_c0_g1_i2:111-1520(+)